MPLRPELSVYEEVEALAGTMAHLSQRDFLATLPQVVLPHLPPLYQRRIQTRQPWRYLIQFHFGEPRLHYEVSRLARRAGYELAFHCEARDRQLNRFLLDGFRRHLFEIKDVLGEQVEAEMWDRGWTKVYEVFQEDVPNVANQQALGARLAALIVCLQPIYIELRAAVRQFHR